jgi:4a-hydroxytetrahydrobiopterin dehydratase
MVGAKVRFMAMADFAARKCQPCRGDTPPLGQEQAREYLAELHPDWQLMEEEHRLRRRFRFPSFKAAIAFVNQVAELAESQGHHPDITIVYRNVTLDLTTHAIGGLSENDFIMAAKIDELIGSK